VGRGEGRAAGAGALTAPPDGQGTLSRGKSEPEAAGWFLDPKLSEMPDSGVGLVADNRFSRRFRARASQRSYPCAPLDSAFGNGRYFVSPHQTPSA